MVGQSWLGKEDEVCALVASCHAAGIHFSLKRRWILVGLVNIEEFNENWTCFYAVSTRIIAVREAGCLYLYISIPTAPTFWSHHCIKRVSSWRYGVLTEVTSRLCYPTGIGERKSNDRPQTPPSRANDANGAWQGASTYCTPYVQVPDRRTIMFH